MPPVSRRTILIVGGVGGLTALVGGAGLLWGSTGSQLPGGTGTLSGADDLLQPEMVRSDAGLLRVRLSSAEAAVRIGGREATVLTYNGSLPGPTLVLRPGDRLEVELENGLDAITNLHVHGLHVTPRGNGDNVLLAIDPGDTVDYAYDLPADHAPGVYWYHPHHHGNTADQVAAGLYGAIIVEDPEPIAVTRERVLVISDLSLDGAGRVAPASTRDRMMGREGELVLVNGQLAPTLSARPGERERWRVVNACTSRYLSLRLDGQGLQLLGMDSGRDAEPESVEEVRLAPGNRADLLVDAASGSSTLRTNPVERGSMPGMMGGPTTTGADLAVFEVSGDAVDVPPPVPRQSAPRDLRDEAVTGRREITLAMGMGGMGASGMAFTIDGREFAADRVDTSVDLGAVEEWTLVNTSPMDHPFHLHVWPMQVVEYPGTSIDRPIWRDVVNLPARSRVRVRVPFEDFTGTTVYHCHILDHEDLGMMGIIEAR
ncbi:multicopper oxidase family protein [Marisediminicola antarctica]|uniref:Copper-containing nitrite reductase n=1 Tax=Marisediminicola antarctica TaxID=674079 RepID=A0A7L5AK96_9MICO|nr:multicopper oxidase family protein [Marisediminicola antarctica]QHO71023.1 copper oxidase [Marisediminicola antarctica]